MSTYYDILRVPEDADDKQVKAAYKQAALAYHPDHIPKGVSKRMREDAAQAWLQIQEAFDVLGDPAKRREYDTLLEEMRQSEEIEQQFEAPVPPPDPPKPEPAPAPDLADLPAGRYKPVRSSLWLSFCFQMGRHWRWSCWILTAFLFVRNGVRNSETWAIAAGGVAVTSAIVAFLIVVSSGLTWRVKGRYIINATTVIALVITVIITDSISTAPNAKPTVSTSHTSIATTPKSDYAKWAMNQTKGQGQFQSMDYPHGYLVNELCARPTNVGNDTLCYPTGWKPWLKELQQRTAGDDAEAIRSDSGTQGPGNLVVSWDGQPRVVFGGCRPHLCTDGRVYFLVATTANELDIIWRNERGVIKYLGPNSAFLRASSAYELLEAKQIR